MSLPRYPKYKPSGVEWLGDVPEGWEVDRIKRSVLSSKNGVWGAEPQQDESDIPCVRVADFDRQKLRVELSEPTIRNVVESERVGRVLCKGDLLLEKAGGGELQPVGCVVLYDDDRPAVCSNFVARVQVAPGMNASFWRYAHAAAYAVRLNTRSIKQTSGIQNLDGSQYFDERAAFPPLPEQTAIAEFLDRETAKIDGLVAEQRRLMELLKEKRQAVISHAVTKGLNPHAPMKPSGIEWLGDVPAGWDVLPLKRIVAVPITDGPHETPQFVEEGVPFVSAEAVSSGQIDFTKVRACITPEDNARYSTKYSPKLHDIYMVKSGATTGVTAIVEDRTDFNIWSPLAVIRCNSGSVPHFVLNFMRSRHFLEAVTLFWSFGTQQNIGMGVIENLACTVPPVEEQLDIARYLATETAKFDTLTAEAQRAIDLLQERRTALISAAVAGQIDVRQHLKN
jgi:type I restriction enzyme S subunit